MAALAPRAGSEGSTSSTPRTSTATATASSCSRSCAASARSRSTSRPRRGGGCPSRRSTATAAKNLTSRSSTGACKNLATETIDLLQLHCPPTGRCIYHPEVFGILDDLVKAGKIRFYGVSVERVEEALKAIDYPGVQSVQIIYNMFRQRPADLFFAEARRRKVGMHGAAAAVIGDAGGQDDARERVRRRTTIAATTARASTAIKRRNVLRRARSSWAWRRSRSCASWRRARPAWRRSRLRWILMNDAVTCVIPGAKRPSSGRRQLRGGRPAGAGRRDHGARARALRAQDQEPRPLVLVGYW